MRQVAASLMLIGRREKRGPSVGEVKPRGSLIVVVVVVAAAAAAAVGVGVAV